MWVAIAAWVVLVLFGLVIWILKWAIICAAIAFFVVLFTPDETLRAFKGKVETIVDELKDED